MGQTKQCVWENSGRDPELATEYIFLSCCILFHYVWSMCYCLHCCFLCVCHFFNVSTNLPSLFLVYFHVSSTKNWRISWTLCRYVDVHVDTEIVKATCKLALLRQGSTFYSLHTLSPPEQRKPSDKATPSEFNYSFCNSLESSTGCVCMCGGKEGGGIERENRAEDKKPKAKSRVTPGSHMEGRGTQRGLLTSESSRIRSRCFSRTHSKIVHH